jgi:transcription antitermination protein NusB
MSRSRDMRRCALQAMYQFDTGRADDLDDVRASLAGSPGDDAAHEQGFALATMAWEFRESADAEVAALTPEWPTHRQPIIDRNVLRLAWYEMTQAGTPPKVAINEAVELAREFSTDRSPLFINGVLDKIYKKHMLTRAKAVADQIDSAAGADADRPQWST